MNSMEMKPIPHKKMGKKLKNKIVEGKMNNRDQANHVSTREGKIQEGKTPHKTPQCMKMDQHKRNPTSKSP